MTEILTGNGIFHLRNDRISYVLQNLDDEFLMHVYFGPRLRDVKSSLLSRFRVTRADKGPATHNECLPDAIAQEYPTFGYGDLREGALQVVAPDGTRVVAPQFRSFETMDGKPGIEGLPFTFDAKGECKTLKLKLADDVIGLECDLYYSIFDDCDVVARHAVVRNVGGGRLVLERAMSASVDFHTADYNLLTLSGAWSRERRMDVRPLRQGEQSVSSARGASSLQSSPFLALMDKNATETSGEVIGFALVYSGNFYAGVTVDQFQKARTMIGVNPFDFAWQLEPGDSFATPEAVLCYSADGLGGMSRSFHTLCKSHLARGKYAQARRPYLINNWEATYFNFDEEKLLSIAAKAAELGVELFVLDDGWFGKRDNDDCSLGDWVEDRQKLPGGLEQLSRKIHALGLQFGLWFEPEMVSPNSDLYRAHPDWCIHVNGRERLVQRHQLVLDLSRPEVCDYIYHAVADVLSRAPIDYVKWDMNRNFSPIGSGALPAERQREMPHRYMLGLYGVLEKLVNQFPDVLFESCASGGGRFDMGMMYYMPQAWCSDNTDAATRCYIQHGTSLVFPPCMMGAHVSAVPSHQTGRVTHLQSRADVAAGGTFGYELDVTKLPESEQEEIRQQLKRVKTVRDTLMYGDEYRLRSPYDTNYTAWMLVSADKREAVVTCVKMSAESNVLLDALKLRGLDPNATYRVEETGERFGGDELMNLGLTMDYPHYDYASLSFILRAE